MGLRWFCILAVCFGLAPEALQVNSPAFFNAILHGSSLLRCEV